jgi:N-acetyltransferase 10
MPSNTRNTIIRSTNPDFNKAIIRVNITRNNRQTVQYISPNDTHLLNAADLLIIDEAAAIPLPLVKAMLGPYLVFMASTINGYEDTGRSLSLKSQIQKDNNAPPPVGCELSICHRISPTPKDFYIVSICVSSHYKNSPNDLQMMSDAPAHHLFCVLGLLPGCRWWLSEWM